MGKEMKDLASTTAVIEGKRSQTSISNIRETQKVTQDVLAYSAATDGLLYNKWKAQLDKKIAKIVKKLAKATK